MNIWKLVRNSSMLDLSVANAVALLCKALTLSVVAWMQSPAEVGIYGLALAIAAPVQLFSNFRLRSLLSSDSSEEISLATYQSANAVTSAGAFLILVVLAVALGAPLTPVLVAVSAVKMTESFSDLRYGALQMVRAHRQVAVSVIMRSVLGVIFFSLMLAKTSSLPLAVLTQLGTLVMVGGLVEIPLVKRSLANSQRKDEGIASPLDLLRGLRDRARWSAVKGLLVTGFPLAIASLITSFSGAVGTYISQVLLGAEATALFVVANYGTAAVGIFAGAVTQRSLPSFATDFRHKNWNGIASLLTRETLFFAPIGVAVTALGWVLGPVFIGLFFGDAYAVSARLLPLLTLGATLFGVGSIAEAAATGIRKTRVQPVLDGTVLVVAISSNWILCKTYGLEGLAVATILTGAVSAIMYNSVVWLAIKSRTE